MAKKMLIDATHPEETRVVVADGNKVEEFDFESENKRQLAGNIYLAKVTRVEPSLQAAFIDYGGNRHGFLAFSEIHPDYYQIPVADRLALLEEEAEFARQQAEEEDKPKKGRGRGRGRSKAAKAKSEDAVISEEVEDADAVSGMDVVEQDADDVIEVEEGSSPMETVAETPVETPEASDEGQDGDDDSDGDSDDGDDDDVLQATDKDENIESVAQEDDADEVRPARKPRPKRYKIQEVVKVRQILLVQVVKEERGNKGAALTTYLSLAGRYCVLMPNTARGGGISRKITNAADRKKLKEIANEIDVPKGAGLIVRTAGAKRTKSEIKRDYEYLQRHWEQVRALTLKSIAPAPIYEEGDLIKRSIRDLYNREIDEVLVEGEMGYRTAKDFMKMIMPSHAKNVKHYAETMPLFARYQVESYLGGMFNPTVQLRSGGYIVIGVTEALVAIDVNSGRATKEGSIEETALKTNLEAAEEAARQLRLRDLAGLIVIDFIDMEERRNNAAVEKRLKDKLKTDRARIQVGRISGFGLLEMSRQRLRPGMLEASTQPCPSCHGTGLVRSDDSLGLTILRQIEEEGTRRKAREVLVKAPVSIVNFLMNQKREHVAQIEARYGMSVRIEGDPFLISPDFSIEKFKTATRPVRDAAPVVSVDASIMSDIDDEEIAADTSEAPEAPGTPATPEASEADEGAPKKKRRRRRRRRGSGGGDAQGSEAQGDESQVSDAQASEDQSEGSTQDAKADEATEADAPAVAADEAKDGDAPAKPKRTRTRSRRKKTDDAPAEAETADAVADAPVEAAEPAPEAPEVEAPEAEAPKPKKPRATRSRKKKTEEAPVAAEAQAEPAPEPQAEAPAADPAPAPEPELAEATADAGEAEKKPRRRGWWSMGRS